MLFAVESYAAYGALSGRSVDDMIAGARVEVAPYKRNPMDFVLWKPSTPDLPGWDSPWGRGRPGWHIECSAMAHELLGDAFDIHGGGTDLMFPHHENEIAQSRCAFPDGRFANLWLHNEMLQVDGKKMSKSLGNFFTVRDLLDRGVPGEVIRFVLLSTHYRKPMDWTAEKAREAEAVLTRWYELTDGVAPDAAPDAKVVAALADDLNTHLALDRLHQIAKPKSAGALKASMALLGFADAEVLEWFRKTEISEDGVSVAVPVALDGPAVFAALRPWLSDWQALREARDFVAADSLKARLEALGLRVEARPAGPHASVLTGFQSRRWRA